MRWYIIKYKTDGEVRTTRVKSTDSVSASRLLYQTKKNIKVISAIPEDRNGNNNT